MAHGVASRAATPRALQTCLEQNLAGMPSVTEMMHSGLDAQGITARLLGDLARRRARKPPSAQNEKPFESEGEKARERARGGSRFLGWEAALGTCAAERWSRSACPAPWHVTSLRELLLHAALG